MQITDGRIEYRFQHKLQYSLSELRFRLPSGKKQIFRHPGKTERLWKSQAEKYGDDIIGLVVDYCSQHEIQSNIAAKKETPKRERKERSTGIKMPTNLVSFNLFKEGKIIADIEKERNLSTGTIEGHLVAFVACKQINIDHLVPAENRIWLKKPLKRTAKKA